MSPKSPGKTLSGWAGIEDHLMTNDAGEMEDYADDIDTLLVFVSDVVAACIEG